MTLAASLLINNASTTDGTSFTTASISPSANRLILAGIAVGRTDTTSPSAPTSVVGAGLTFTEEDSNAFLNTGATRERLSLWRAVGAAGSGTVAITCGETIHSCAWIFVEVTGVRLGGTNGSLAVRQSEVAVESGGNPSSATLAAFSAPLNRPLAVFGQNNATNTIAEEAGWTMLGSTQIGTPGISLSLGWNASTADLQTDWTAGVGAGGSIITEIVSSLGELALSGVG